MMRGWTYALPLFMLLGTFTAQAQENAPAAATSPGFPVATIDVLYIYQHHSPVVEKMESLKQSLGELEKTIQIRQVEIESLQRKLQSPPRQGEDREKMQLQLVKLQTELRLFVERERQQVQKRELGIQVETYKQIQEEVAKIAKERGLKLVLVKAKRSLDSENLVEMTQALNQTILFEEGIDITSDVLAALTARLKAANDK